MCFVRLFLCDSAKLLRGMAWLSEAAAAVRTEVDAIKEVLFLHLFSELRCLALS